MHCDRHVEADASHQCQRCHKWHCGACVRKVQGLQACAHCDGVLRHAPTETIAEGTLAIQALVMRVLTKEGALTALALAVPGFLGMHFGFALYFIYFGAMCAYYFLTVEHVGEGKPGLPGPKDTSEDVWDVVGQIVRGLLVMSVGSVPFLIFSLLGGNTPDSPVGGWVTMLVLHAMGFVLLPAVILAVVLTNRTLAAVWPFAWAAVIRRAPGPYLRLVALFTLSTLVMVFATAGGFFFFAPVPMVGYLLVIGVTNAFLIMQACLIGGFVYREQLAFRS